MMKRMLLFVMLCLLTVTSFAHVWEIRVNQAQNGTLTWYLQSYHSLGECGIANSGLTINGVNYPLQAEYSGSSAGLSNTIFAADNNYAIYGRNSYAIVTTPFLGTSLNVQPYSENACWYFLVGGSGNFTPPPPPVCTTCPITGWSNANGTPNNNGTACNSLDDYLPTTVTVNHLTCASITTGGKFRVVFDPSGANVSYGPYNFTTGNATSVNLNLPYGVTSSTQLNVVSDSFPCNVAHGLTIPGGTFNGVTETVPPVISCPINIAVNNDLNKCGAKVNYSLPTATDNCTIQNLVGDTTFTFTGSIVNFTVPSGVTKMTITAKGAQGGGSTNAGGLGASMQGTFNVTPNQTLKILVGGQGQYANSRAGGGGGSFVTTSSNNPLVIAGGGGGAGNCGYSQGMPGVTSTSATTFANVMAGGPGTNGGGGGGGVSGSGGGGGGFYGNGGNGTAGSYSCSGGSAGGNGTDAAHASCGPFTTPGGLSFLNGGTGGVSSNGANGGFGGGGSAYQWNCGGGGGGGYSGGGGGGTDLASSMYYHQVGGGGGSFNGGTNQTNTAGANSGNGQVTISWNIGYLTQIQGLAPGADFPVGTTTNTYVATDAVGNTDTCSFTVTVTDNQAPAIACPSNISVNNDAGMCGAVVNYTAPVGTDNCPGATTTQIAGRPSGSFFAVGVTTNTFEVKDANGNKTTCSFTVTVTDAEAPSIVCPANISVSNDAGMCGAVVNYTAPSGSDNCPGATTTQIAGRPSGSLFAVGVTTNTFEVKDANGNKTTCSFTVTVTDNEAPVIACAANIAVNNDAGICGAKVTYTAPVGTDNCPGATTTQTAGLASGATFPVGTTTNTFVVTDANNNTNTCSFTVTVTDNEAPSITCASNIAVNNDLGICGAVVTYNAPVGTDNCPGATTTQTAGLASGSVFPLGTTTNTFVVTDAYNQTNTCSFTVTVTDNEAPSIACAANISVNNDAGICGAVVNFSAPSTSDNCGVAGTVQTAGMASGATFPVGSTTNTFVVTDVNGNTNTCSFTVTVTDNEAPSITCASNISVNNDADVCGAVVSFNAPTTSDNCAVSGTVQTAGLASGSTFPVGTTTNTFVVTDIYGNTNTCSFTVKVTDNQAPAAVCKNYTLNLSGGTGTVYPADVNNSSSDNCAIATMSVSPNTFTCADAGTNTVTLTVTDIYGNSSTCNATVTVQYQPTCTITTTPANSTYTGGNPNNIYLGYGPQSATITTNATGGSGFTYSWSPSANLSCTNCQSPVFTPTAAGNYTYTVTATNSNGCATTCIVKFCVMDIRVPASNNKVYLCHVPPGNPNNPQTLSISVNAVPSHLGQHSGDRLGMCSMSCGSGSKGNNGEEVVYEEEHSHEAAMEMKELKVYPNPNNGRFTIELPEQVNGGQAAILDMSGRVIRNVGFEKNTKLEIDLGSVSNGVYMVQILNSGKVYRALVTVQN